MWCSATAARLPAARPRRRRRCGGVGCRPGIAERIASGAAVAEHAGGVAAATRMGGAGREQADREHPGGGEAHRRMIRGPRGCGNAGSHPIVAAMRALDRVLRARRDWIPSWFLANHRSAYWDMFGFPERKPDFDFPVEALWWVDKGKAAKIGKA